jgi:LysW-gamma-L-lysine carboxypeptidase
VNQDIQLLHELVSIYSPSTQEQEASAYLVQAMRRRGYDDVFVDGAGNAVGIWGKGAREIVLLGHIDTVAGFIPVRLVVIGAVEEEAASSKGARHVIEQYRPECCIIGEPSQWQCITLGYKGRLLIDYTLRGAVSHSAGQLPSAPEVAVDFWNNLLRRATLYNQDCPVFDRLDVSLRSINSSSDGIQEVVTQRLGLRLPLAYDVEGLKAQLLEEAGPAQLQFFGQEVAHRTDKSNPLVKAFLKGIREAGGNPKFKVKTGTSDMNVVAPHWQCPIVAYGPGDSAFDHTPQEQISLEEYGRAIAVLQRTLHLLVRAPAVTA